MQCRVEAGDDLRPMLTLGPFGTAFQDVIGSPRCRVQAGEWPLQCHFPHRTETNLPGVDQSRNSVRRWGYAGQFGEYVQRREARGVAIRCHWRAYLPDDIERFSEVAL
jgi:hypothetical protein